jgi:hypothetical protein
MTKSRVRINLTGKTAKPQDKTVDTRPRSRVRINLTGKQEETTAPSTSVPSSPAAAGSLSRPRSATPTSRA